MNDIFNAVALIIFAGFISIELGVASAIFEILAGFIAGNFFNFSNVEAINILADFGVLSLMYLAGLEIDFDILKKNMKSSVMIGSASFFTPFLAISYITMYFLDYSLQQALLVGIALSTTSIAIVYPLLLRSGNRLDEIGKKILSTAMIVDLLSMIALSLLFADVTIITLVFIILFFIFSYFVPFLGRRIFSHYKGNVVEFEFKIILFLILGIGIAGEAIGVEAVLLAFILGIITSSVIVEHARLWDKLRGITFGFLAPIFFFKVGTTLSLISLIENMWLILLFLVVSFIFNFIGTYFISKIYMSEQAYYVSILLNSNLSFGIVAASVGLELRIISEGIYASLIGAVILSSVLASFLAKNGYDNLE